MRVLIQTYRGWEIYFDTENEEFYTMSNQFDTDKTKKSYSSAIKYIDDYIKENYKFTPFYVQKMPSIYDNRDTTIKIIGIRKDGRFMYEDKDGSKHQLTEYDAKNYFKVNPENEPIFKEIHQLKDDISKLEGKVKELMSKVVKEELTDILRKLKPNL